jgi:hypothetical protein
LPLVNAHSLGESGAPRLDQLLREVGSAGSAGPIPRLLLGHLLDDTGALSSTGVKKSSGRWTCARQCVRIPSFDDEAVVRSQDDLRPAGQRRGVHVSIIGVRTWEGIVDGEILDPAAFEGVGDPISDVGDLPAVPVRWLRRRR